MRILLFSLFFFIFGSCQSDEKRQNKILDSTKEGHIDNSRHGLHLGHSDDGSVLSMTYYNKGKIDSIQQLFYSNSVIKSEYNWLEGRRFGIQKEFDSTGRLASEYFILGCDTCMTSDVVFSKTGAVENKRGSFVNIVHAGKNFKVSDTVNTLFYTLVPSGFIYKFTLVEKAGNAYKRIDTSLTHINNNLAFLFSKKYNSTGLQEIGGVVEVFNKKAGQKISDSAFYSFTIY